MVAEMGMEMEIGEMEMEFGEMAMEIEEMGMEIAGMEMVMVLQVDIHMLHFLNFIQDQTHFVTQLHVSNNNNSSNRTP
jgi:hypothetical protein